MEKKYTKKPNLIELIQAFSDNRDLVVALAYFYENQLKAYNEFIDKYEFAQWFREIDDRYIALVKLKKFLKFTKKENKSKFLDLQKAKIVPIQDLYDFTISRETSKRIQVRCPFHDENNASMFIYKDSNTFHCFGCLANGDSIAFVQKMYGLNFVEAVKRLR